MLLYFLLLIISPTGNAGVDSMDSIALSPDKCPAQRDIWEILKSCFSTIILCSWSSVHFNIPPPGKIRRYWIRFKLMLWSIIAPELILAWAVRQWFAASVIRDIYNQYRPFSQKWTKTHGQFLVMGGFILVDPPTFSDSEQSASRVLSFEHFQVLVRDPTFEFPPVTEDEINDKSKGDFVAKSLAITHTTWFIVQVIARGIKGWAITELELITLALASLNAVTYCFWWNKPLHVQEPIRIYLSSTLHLGQPSVARTRVQLEWPDFGLGNNSDTQSNCRNADLSMSQTFSFIKELVKRTSGAVYNTLFRPQCRAPLPSLLNWLSLPFCFLFFITFPIFVLFPICLGFLLKINFKHPRPPFQRPGPLIFQILDTWTCVPSNHTRQLRFTFLSWLDKDSDLDSIPVSLFIWFLCFPVMLCSHAVMIFVFIPSFHILFTLIYVVFSSLFDIVTTCTVHPSAIRVPAFYAPITKSDRYSRMTIFALFGICFGGIHCIPWHFSFPSPFEQKLWRIMSVMITAIPIVVGPLDFIISWRSGSGSEFSAGVPLGGDDTFVFIEADDASGIVFQGTDRVRKIRILREAMRTSTYSSLEFIMNLLLCAYLPARIALIAQALACLRAPPPTAYLSLNWTYYLPHIA